MRPDRALRGEALTVESWEEPFEKALRSGDILGASDILRKIGRDGWVKRAEIERAVRVVDRVAPAALVRREWSLTLLAHPRRVDKELAAVLLTPLARSHTRDVERAFERMAQDADAGVRAAAARLATTLVGEAYPELRAIQADEDVLRLLRGLGEDPSPIARQVARSAIAAIAAKRPELAAALGQRPAAAGS